MFQVFVFIVVVLGITHSDTQELTLALYSGYHSDSARETIWDTIWQVKPVFDLSKASIFSAFCQAPELLFFVCLVGFRVTSSST